MSVVSSRTEKRLETARQSIASLEKTAREQADSGTLPHDVVETELDVAAAGKKFLRATDENKLGQKTNKEKGRGADPKLEDGWTTLRFRISLEQRDVIAAAMERAREIADTIDGKLWKGVALEYLAAEFLAAHGAPTEIPEPEYTDTPG